MILADKIVNLRKRAGGRKRSLQKKWESAVSQYQNGKVHNQFLI